MIGKSTPLLILKIFLVPILKMLRLIIVVPLVLSMILPMMICLQVNTFLEDSYSIAYDDYNDE
jgi:hypothetical protein